MTGPHGVQRLTLYPLFLQRALVNPMSFWRKGLSLPGKADPISRRDILFYSDAKKNRGYLGLQAMREHDEDVREVAARIVASESQSETSPAVQEPQTKPEA